MTNKDILPSVERVHVEREPALADDGGYLASDLGPALTCAEAEVLADLFAAWGKHDAADTLREGHLDDCDERSRHTGGPCPEDAVA